jgi:hypothetical protein
LNGHLKPDRKSNGHLISSLDYFVVITPTIWKPNHLNARTRKCQIHWMVWISSSSIQMLTVNTFEEGYHLAVFKNVYNN